MKGNISFSSLLFCFRSAAFLLWVLLLIAIFLSKLCGQPLSINRFLKSEILPQRSLFVGFSRLLVCQIHFNNWWVVRGENVYTGRFPFKMRLYVNDSFFSFFVECCALVYNRVLKDCLSGWCVSLLVPWIWRNLRYLVYFCPTGKCHLCSVFKQLVWRLFCLNFVFQCMRPWKFGKEAVCAHRGIVGFYW